MPKIRLKASRKTTIKPKRNSSKKNNDINIDAELPFPKEQDDVSRRPYSPNTDKNINLKNSDLEGEGLGGYSRHLNDTDSEENLETNGDFVDEMTELLRRFSNDIIDTMNAERRKVEQFTEEATNITIKRISEANESFCVEKAKLLARYEEHFLAMIQQGEAHLGKIKEAEDKLLDLLVQKKEPENQVIEAQAQILNSLKNLLVGFCEAFKTTG